jgi:RNA polymerase sigma-70 factor (ECF subfamily)
VTQHGDAITALLTRTRGGDADAMNQLLPLVYQELHDVAARAFKRERRAITLQPTALVHEAYLQLIKNQGIRWRDRGHFYAVAALLMRRILVDHARARHAKKRGGLNTRIALAGIDAGTAMSEESQAFELVALDQLLTRLAARNARQATVVELRVFAGLTVDETAEALGLSPRTIKGDWQLARAWLIRELGRA